MSENIKQNQDQAKQGRPKRLTGRKNLVIVHMAKEIYDFSRDNVHNSENILRILHAVSKLQMEVSEYLKNQLVLESRG